MITMKLKGGLGNQLFQYALGRHLSIMHDTSLILDISSYNNDKLRDYALDLFCLSKNITLKKLPASGTIFSKLKIRDALSLFSLCKEQKLITEQKFNFMEEIFLSSDDSELDGYWQSAKYFCSIEEIIRSEVKLKLPISPYIDSVIKNIKNTNSVSIHVRRGDYADNPTTNSYHGLCSPDWYHEASKLMLDKFKDCHFFIFSDDYEWTISNLKIDGPSTYVSPSPKGSEAEDLIAMSCCNHNIIANSSFSWWGAWLNPNKEKQIIAPSKWFLKGDHDTRDLLPDSWIKL